MDKNSKASDRSTRRGFLGAVTGTLAGPLIVPASALGRGATPPSDRIALGIIGSGSRGMFESKYWMRSDDCEVVAVCDVREKRRVDAKAMYEKLYAQRKPSGTYGGIRLYNDFRELLRQKDIDAVYIATPDHWHVAMTMAAQAAGKHCHTEKPLGICIDTDLACLKAVKKYGRSFLYGAERRSEPQARHAIELVLNGRIGKVQKIFVVSPASRAGGSATPMPVPPGWDYDLWLGPAPQAPFCEDRCLKAEGIFQIRDYSLGMLGNWGAHPLDQVQLWADHADVTIPVTYSGSGRIAEGGLYDCATQWHLRCTYENGLVLDFSDDETFKKLEDAPKGLRPLRNVALFVGTEGWLASTYEKVFTEPASLMTSEIGPNEIHLPRATVRDEELSKGLNVWEAPTAPHQLGWIEYLKSIRGAKKPAQTVDPIESAVRSDLIAQLSDICIRTGRTIHWDEKKQTITGDEVARKMMSRPMREPWATLVKKLGA